VLRTEPQRAGGLQLHLVLAGGQVERAVEARAEQLGRQLAAAPRRQRLRVEPQRRWRGLGDGAGGLEQRGVAEVLGPQTHVRGSGE